MGRRGGGGGGGGGGGERKKGQDASKRKTNEEIESLFKKWRMLLCKRKPNEFDITRR